MCCINTAGCANICINLSWKSLHIWNG
jgi:hypothetical protein